MNLGGYLSISGIVAGAWVGSMIYKRFWRVEAMMETAIGRCLVAFIFGSIVGLLVRSRFCNTAALRDAILFKTYRNTKALLAAMMISRSGSRAFLPLGRRQ